MPKNTVTIRVGPPEQSRQNDREVCHTSTLAATPKLIRNPAMAARCIEAVVRENLRSAKAEREAVLPSFDESTRALNAASLAAAKPSGVEEATA
jgi:hypothetical protein